MGGEKYISNVDVEEQNPEQITRQCVIFFVNVMNYTILDTINPHYIPSTTKYACQYLNNNNASNSQTAPLNTTL